MYCTYIHYYHHHYKTLNNKIGIIVVRGNKLRKLGDGLGNGITLILVNRWPPKGYHAAVIEKS